MSLIPLLAIAPIALLSPSLLRAQSRAPKLEAAELPMAFEPAARPGEAPRFRARGQGYVAELTAEGADLLLAPRGDAREPALLSLRFPGGRARALRAEGASHGQSHFYKGRNARSWRTHVPRRGRVRLVEVWPGVDAVFYGMGRRLEYDLVFAPGRARARVELELRGARGLRVAADGALLLDTPAGDRRQEPPVAFQEGPAGREPVAARYRVAGATRFAIELGAHDPARALVVDPVLSYASYIGGTGDEGVSSVAVDATGHALLVGTTFSKDLPLVKASQTALKGSFTDVFVARVAPDGKSLVYATYLGGSGTSIHGEKGIDIAADAAGNAYVTGKTDSTDFPVKNARQAKLAGGVDAFLTKLSPAGLLLWSTYHGGSGAENHDPRLQVPFVGGAVAVDKLGNAYLAGSTESTNLPVLNAYKASFGGVRDAFLSKFDPNGKLLASTYFGGKGSDQAHELAVDAAGGVYLVGNTVSSDFPLSTGALEKRTDRVGFVTRFAPTLKGLVYSTRFRLPPFGVAVDRRGSAYVTGTVSGTGSSFPVTFGAYMTQRPPSTSSSRFDTFVSKLDPAGTRLVYSTYVAYPWAGDGGTGIAVDASGHAYVAASISHRGVGSHVVKLNPTGSGVVWDFNLKGGAVAELALGPKGGVYVAGLTHDARFPVTAGAFQTTYKGTVRSRGDGFVAKLVESPATKLAGLAVGSPRILHRTKTTGQCWVDGAAPAGGALVTLSSSNPALLQVPARAFVAPGQSTATFPITSSAVSAITQATIRASWGGVTKTQALTVWWGPSYRIRDLGALSSGANQSSKAFDIDDAGQTVGTSRGAGFRFNAFVHGDASGMKSLGAGSAVAINASGQIALASGSTGVLLSKGTRTSVPAFAGGRGSTPTGLNDKGWICGWGGLAGGLGQHAYLWTPKGGTKDLGALSGGSMAYGVNNAGLVVGESFVASGTRHAFTWTAAQGMVDIGTLPGHGLSVAYAVNERGQVTGISAPLNFSAPRAFRFEKGKAMKDLGVLAGDAHSLGYAIDDFGAVVGFSSKARAVNQRAFRYTELGGMEEILSLLDPREAFDWQLVRARGINNLGQIVGEGNFRGNDFKPSAFRVDPTDFVGYGAGCAGTGGSVPAIRLEGTAIPGGKVALSVANARPSSISVLFLGTARASTALPGGCRVLVGGATFDLGVPILLDAKGGARVAGTLPKSVPVGSLFLQLFVVDPQAANTLFTTSNGVELAIR